MSRRPPVAVLRRVSAAAIGLAAVVAATLPASGESEPTDSGEAGEARETGASTETDRAWIRPGDPTTPDVVLAQAPAGTRYHFPGAAKLENGTILVAAREGAGHSDPSGRIVLLESSDNGETWSDARVIHDSPGDDRDSKLSQDSRGRVFLHFFVSDPGATGALTGDFVKYSDDRGATWSDAYRVSTAMDGKSPTGAVGWAATHGDITEAPDGTLLAPIYGKLPTDATFCRASVVRSLDGGATWLAENEVFLPSVDCVNEAVLTALPDGSMTALLRVDKANTPKWEMRSELTRSYDGGRTWTPAVKLNLATSSAETLVLDNGDVFLAYGDHTGRFGQRRLTSATVIRHPDRAWDVQTSTPVWDAFVDDQANPAIVEVEPGRVMVVGFDYTSRSLVATYVDVDDVDSMTDDRQLRDRIDLQRMVERGEARIETTLTAIDPFTSATGPLGAVDGRLGVNRGALGTTREGSYTVHFDEAQRIREIGVALRPGEAQPAVVEIQDPDGHWREVATLEERFRYGDVDWLRLDRAESVTAVRVTTKPMVGPRPPNSGAAKPVVLSELALR